MSSEPGIALGSSARRIRLDTLIALRWIAIGGQSAAILVVWLPLHYPMPVVASFALTAISAWLNLYLRIRFSPNLRLGNNQAVLLLGYDALQLGGLLYLTGGLQNPFALLLLVPVMVSATALPLRQTITLGALTVLIATILWPFHLPLPWEPGEWEQQPALLSAASGSRSFPRSAFRRLHLPRRVRGAEACERPFGDRARARTRIPPIRTRWPRGRRRP